MIGAVVGDEVMGQLVAEDDPPVDGGLGLLLGGVEAGEVELVEEAVVAEEAALAVEGDGGPGLVVEDVDAVSAEGEDVAAVEEDGGEGAQAGVGAMLGGWCLIDGLEYSLMVWIKAPVSFCTYRNSPYICVLLARVYIFKRHDAVCSSAC